MFRTSEDRHFARFCRTGDPGALAVVFDRTAPEMLRVAAHLCGDPHRAEDLVQATFVTAIEDCGGWDRRQRVLPWLLGILANRARHAHRQDRRQPDPGRLRAEASEDPAAAAESRELTEAMSRALDAVPPTYRELLRLHLERGLGAAEIAQRSGRSAGTVRMQLRRGLDHLRRALPPSFAAATAAVVAPGRGLAAVRAEVLTAAARSTPAAASSGAIPLLLGMLLMKKTLLAGAALIVAALTLYTVIPSASPPAGGEPIAAAVAGADLDAEPSTRVAPPSRVEAPPARVTAAPSAAQPNLDTRMVRARVRVLDGLRIPVPSAVVYATGGGSEYLLGKTDEQGELAHTSRDSVAFRALAEGYAMSSTVYERRRLAAGDEVLVELVLDAAPATLHGRVLDARGFPVADAEVMVQGPHGPRGKPPRPQQVQTGADGSFAMTALHGGQTRVLATSRAGGGPARWAESRLELTPGEETEIQLQLAAGGVVFGTLRDLRGEPLIGAVVIAGLLSGDWRFHLADRVVPMTETDLNGDYRIEGLLPGRYHLRYMRGDGNDAIEHFESLDVGQEIRWDPTPRAPRRWPFRVRDANGDPLTGWTVRVACALQAGYAAETDAEGRCTFESMADDVHTVTVTPPGQDLAVLMRTDVRPSTSDYEIRILPHQLPSAHIKGVLRPLGGIGRATLSVAVGRWRLGQVLVTVDPATGAFQAGPLPAGDYELLIRSGDTVVGTVAARSVAAGSTVDYGDIAVGTGSLIVGARDRDGRPIRDLRVCFMTGDLVAAAGGGERVNADWLFEALPASRFNVLVAGRGMAPQRQPVQITPGDRTELLFEAQPGTPCAVRVPLPELPPAQTFVMCEVKLVDADGHVVWTEHVRTAAEEEAAIFRCGLAPGRYGVDIRLWVATGPLQGETSFEVGTAPVEPVVEVR